MKNGLILISLTVLVGCGSLHSRQANNDGTHNLSCHSINGTNETCVKHAEKLCSEGFSILEKQSYKIEYASNGDGFYMPPKYELTVLCNPT